MFSMSRYPGIIFLVVAAVLGSSARVSAIPEGGTCDTAINIGALGTFDFDMSVAVQAGPCPGNPPSMWFRFTAPSDGNLIADASNSLISPHVAIYLSNACPPLCEDRIPASSSNTFGRTRSVVTLLQGQTCLIAVSRSVLDTGEQSLGVLQTSFVPTPQGNTCADAIIIDADGTTPFDTTHFALGQPCRNGEDSPVVWFEFVAPNDGTVVADTCGTTFDTLLWIYEGDCPEGCPTPLASNDDFCGLQSRAEFPVTGGLAYRMAVNGFRHNRFGPGVLNMSFTSWDFGDINGDTFVNVADVTELGIRLRDNDLPSLAVGDINNDGVINDLDMQALAELIVE